MRSPGAPSVRGMVNRLRLPSTVVVTLAAALALSACGDDTPTASAGGAENPGGAGSPSSGGDLSGTLSLSGASSQESAMTAWIAGYQQVQPDVTVHYDAVGSGAGRENLISGASPMIGSDAYLDEEERAAVVEQCGPGGALHLPAYISPVAIPYNLPGVDRLNLSPENLARIFNQEITRWDDPALAADNPDVELPATDITVVNRSDESGTTENLTEYLAGAGGEER